MQTFRGNLNFKFGTTYCSRSENAILDNERLASDLQKFGLPRSAISDNKDASWVGDSTPTIGSTLKQATRKVGSSRISIPSLQGPK